MGIENIPKPQIINEEETEELDLRQALEASLVEAALEENFRELEEARMQEAIAISLAFEKQKLEYMAQEVLELEGEQEISEEAQIMPCNLSGLIESPESEPVEIIDTNEIENSHINIQNNQIKSKKKEGNLIKSELDNAGNLAHQKRIASLEPIAAAPKKLLPIVPRRKSLEKLKPLKKLSLRPMKRDMGDILSNIEKTKQAIKEQEERLRKKENRKQNDGDLAALRRKETLLQARSKLIESR